MTDQCLPGNCNHIEHNPLLAQLIAWSKKPFNLRQWFLHRKQHRLNRRTYKDLARLDEATLKDIGLSPGDVTWASKLPYSVNAANELEIIARRKSGSGR